MSGFVYAQRARFSHPLFAREKFCRGYAWDWLVAKAVFRDTRISVSGRMVTLRRGQLSYSIRYLADAWRWDKAAVSRFIARLKTETMIETATETGQIVITICNYEKYQSPDRATETATDTATETRARQQRDSSETNKKEEQEEQEREENPLPPLGVSPLKAKTSKRAAPRTRISPDAEASAEQMLAAVTKGLSEREAKLQFEKFRDWAVAKGQVYADWNAAWRNWITSAHFKPLANAAPPGLGSGFYDSMGNWIRDIN